MDPRSLFFFFLSGAVTIYASVLLATLHTYKERRHARMRDIALDIFGSRGSLTVLILQIICGFGSLVIAATVAGEGMKYSYQLFHLGEGPRLQVWIVIFGIFQLFLSALPDLHSLRSIHFFSTACLISTGIIAFGIALHARGSHPDEKKHETKNSVTNIFEGFLGLSIIQFAFGTNMLVEVQATVRDPPVSNFYKSLSLAYSLTFVLYLFLGVGGYWAYGNVDESYLLFSQQDPILFVLFVNILATFSCAASFSCHCHLLFEYYETRFADVTKDAYALRNLGNRLLVRGLVIMAVVFVACLLPFLRDFIALIGAGGLIPVGLIIPILMYSKAYNVSGWNLWLNFSIVAVYSLVALLGVVGSIRFIIVEAEEYSVFSNICVFQCQ